MLAISMSTLWIANMEPDAESFSFLCQHCLATLRAKAAFEGETLACPNCGEPVTIERSNESGLVSTDFPMLDTLTHTQKDLLNFDGMNEEQKRVLNEWAFAIYTAGEQAGDRKAIGRIKATLESSRTIVLDDGSRWALKEEGEPQIRSWNEDDRVAVIDGEMFNLENGEKVEVSGSRS
jgi:predicted RNA-binding Zn-ribbon protein involved in translation (DUF1610 family)